MRKVQILIAILIVCFFVVLLLALLQKIFALKKEMRVLKASLKLANEKLIKENACMSDQDLDC